MAAIQPRYKLAECPQIAIHSVTAADSVKLKNSPRFGVQGISDVLLKFRKRPVLDSDTWQVSPPPFGELWYGLSTAQSAATPGGKELADDGFI